MQKSFATMLIGMLSFSSAYANSFDGFYGSLATGFMSGDINVAATYREQVSSSEITEGITPYSVNLTKTTFFGGLALGVESTFYKFYLLGLEGRANLENLATSSILTISSSTLILPADLNESNESIELQVNAKHDFELLIRLGILLQPNLLLYTIFGSSYAFFDESIFVSNTDTGGLQLGFENNKSGYQLGWMAGIGIDYMVAKNISLALEYTHADYGKLDSLEGVAIIENLPSIYQASYDADVYGKNNNVSFRVTYHFS